MAHDTFKAGDLTAIIGDNGKGGVHRAGYNGVWSLTHSSQSKSLFVPAYAGLNHEHIFDGDKVDMKGSRDVFFEPRRAKMTFKKISATEAELHQPPTPTYHLESWTRFKLVAPHYLDFHYRCKPTQHVFTHGYIGLFWASYINAPEDRSIYFRHNGIWQQLCTQKHNDESTVRHVKDNVELKKSDNQGEALFWNYSPLRFDEPFYYGLFHDHVYMIMFEKADGIRFTHSPSGGGVNRDAQTTNPAWDYQFIIPKYDVMKEYSFKARVVFRERCSRKEILKEWKKFSS